MPFCSSCGSQVAEGVAFCPSCGAPIQKAAQAPPLAQPAAPAYPTQPAYAPPAQYPPGYAAPPGQYPPAYAPPPGQYPPGYAPYPAYGPMPGEKRPAIALILSFFLTGLGQMYNGEMSKGVIFLIVAILLNILTLIFVFTCVISIPFWIYGMYDAYTRADVHNRTLRATGRPPW